MNGQRVEGFFLTPEGAVNLASKLEDALKGLDIALAQLPKQEPQDWITLHDIVAIHGGSVPTLSARCKERSIEKRQIEVPATVGKRKSYRDATQRKDIEKIIHS